MSALATATCATVAHTFAAPDYDLSATLTSGQAFRWQQTSQGWIGVIGKHWVRLQKHGDLLTAETVPTAQRSPLPVRAPIHCRRRREESLNDWQWLTDYLQTEVPLLRILHTFPPDEPLQAAVHACHGLRLLRQDPWECLASFILSSTKQIPQIRQIIARLCECYGEPIAVPPGQPSTSAFPSAVRLATATETELRACKMGFRAPYLLATARLVAAGELDLGRLYELPLAEARAQLMQLPGVGRKIADCVLLFAYGFQSAFPVDVWVLKALKQLYFPRRRVSPKQLRRFADEHFGPYAGYAQQYLFHYMRVANRARQSGDAAPQKRDS